MLKGVVFSMSNHPRSIHPFPDSPILTHHSDHAIHAGGYPKTEGMLDAGAAASSTITALSLNDVGRPTGPQSPNGPAQNPQFQGQPILPWSSVSLTHNTRDEFSSGNRTGRKNKAHTPNACNNCKRAHLGCDAERPCKRCLVTGKQDSCADVPQKKRGRPRLRGGSSVFSASVSDHPPKPPVELEASRILQQLPQHQIAGHKRSDSTRSMKSMESNSATMSSISPISPRAGGSFSSHAPHSSGSLPSRNVLSPTAWLDLELNFIKADDAFRQMFTDVRYSPPQRLSDIASPVSQDTFQTLRSTIRRERDVKDPSYLPPILVPGEDLVGRMGDVNEAEATRGFEVHTYQMAYNFANGVVQTLPTRFNLAKTSRYFVIMTLPPISPDFLSVMVQQAARQPMSRGDPLTLSDLPLTRPSTASSPTWSSSSESRELSRVDSSGRSQLGAARWDRHSLTPQPAAHNSRTGQLPMPTDPRYSGSFQPHRTSERTLSVTSSAPELDITRSLSNESAVFSDDEHGYPRAANRLPPLSMVNSGAEPWRTASQTGALPIQPQAPEKRRKMDIESLLHR